MNGVINGKNYNASALALWSSDSFIFYSFTISPAR